MCPRIQFSRFGLAFVLAAVTLVGAAVVLAQVTDFEIDWWTIESGGVEASAGEFRLVGVLGQPDAAVVAGGEFELEGGFFNRDTAAVPVELMAFSVE